MLLNFRYKNMDSKFRHHYEVIQEVTTLREIVWGFTYQKKKKVWEFVSNYSVMSKSL